MMTLQTWIPKNLMCGTSNRGGSGQNTGVYKSGTHFDNSSEILQRVYE